MTTVFLVAFVKKHFSQEQISAMMTELSYQQIACLSPKGKRQMARPFPAA